MILFSIGNKKQNNCCSTSRRQYKCTVQHKYDPAGKWIISIGWRSLLYAIAANKIITKLIGEYLYSYINEIGLICASFEHTSLTLMLKIID